MEPLHTQKVYPTGASAPSLQRGAVVQGRFICQRLQLQFKSHLERNDHQYHLDTESA